MDDTQQSRALDAAASRKRRSSILKSQRPARTPFSELEFNVATPTDTAKSRRVSFSKRTGVAEFVTNEATTTWKTFYEEHNKTLESPGNEGDVNAPRQIVGHLGKRIFDQFEEVETVDFISSHRPCMKPNVSFNNINLTEQIASLEYMSDGKIAAPQSTFELSAITDHQTKLFGNDFTVTGIGEMSGRIAVNFSAIQQIGEGDDLDEINRDFARVSNVVCRGPKDFNVSEFIEVDLNMTHVMKNDECNMFITNTIPSLKVQDISKNCSVDKKLCISNDWVADKENIAINPYATPCDADNFAVNDESNKVLVFDGKRLTLEIDKPEKDYRKTLLPNASSETPKRKAIVLNINDDLPNFANDLVSKSEVEFGPSIIHNNLDLPIPRNTKVEIKPKMSIGDISLTQVLPSIILSSKKGQNTVSENEINDISITQALPAKIITENIKSNDDQNRSLICNISLTQALPTNIIQNDNLEKRKTILFDNCDGNISITQVLSTNLLLEQKPMEKHATVTFNNDSENLYITQSLPKNIAMDDKPREKNQTVIYEDTMGNISITQVASSNLILSQQSEIKETHRNIAYAADIGDISVTQALSPNIILGQEIEKTQIFDSTNISMTQILPTNILVKDNDVNKRRTIHYEEESGDISITQPVPCVLMPGFDSDNIGLITDLSTQPSSSKCKTIMYCNDSADISMTQAIPSNIVAPALVAEERKPTLSDDDNSDITLYKKAPWQKANEFLLSGVASSSEEKIKTLENREEIVEKQINSVEFDTQDYITATREHCKTVVFTDNSKAEMSFTTAIPNIENLNIEKSPKSKVLDKSTDVLSVTKPIQDDIMIIQHDKTIKTPNKQLQIEEHGITTQKDVLVYQTITTLDAQKICNIKQGDLNKNLIEEKESDTEEDLNKNLIGEKESEIASSDKNDIAVPECKESSDNKVQVKAEFEILDVLTKNSTELPVENSQNLKPRKSLLNSPLDMSTINPSLLAVDDKINISMKTEKRSLEGVSSDNISILTRTEDNAVQTDVIEINNSIEEKMLPQLESATLSTTGHQTSEELISLHNKLANLSTAMKILDCSSNYETTEKIKNDTEKCDDRHNNVSFKNANDTKALLNMISDLADESRCNDESLSRSSPPPIAANDVTSLEEKETQKPKRLSFAPNRLSIAINREDMLHSLSMAKAVLQKSQLELDESCLSDGNQDIDTISKENYKVLQKPLCINREVVKTLHFDDDSVSETCTNHSLLRKSAFGETSYMIDPKRDARRESNKANVIPTYDVTDGIKELMSDLVKPMADVLPYNILVDRKAKNTISNVNKELQANLATSSQIDMDIERPSNMTSHYEIDRSNSYVLQTTNHSFNAADSVTLSHKRNSFTEPYTENKTQSKVAEEPKQEPVLVFDHENPLNNVLIGPVNNVHVHKYDPIKVTVPQLLKSNETLCGSTCSQSCQIDADQIITETESSARVCSKHDFESRLSQVQQAKLNNMFSINNQSISEIQVPVSRDCSVDVHLAEVKNTEVNTIIAMKGNKELLAANSSLTLVDEIATGESKTSSLNECDIEKTVKKSPLRVIFQVEEQESSSNLEKIKSDSTSHDEDVKVSSKAKKRIHKPTTPIKTPTIDLDVTPKPNTKMQKLSISPKVDEKIITPERDVGIHSNRMLIDNINRTQLKKSSQKAKDRLSTSITVQQLLTDYHVEAGINEAIIDNEILKAIQKSMKSEKSDSSGAELVLKSDVFKKDSLEVVSSFTSSKNLNARTLRNVNSPASSLKSQSTIQSIQSSRIDWHPELCSLNSSKTPSDCDSGVNIVAKIDMLPFMGSHECEWDSSSMDTWCFRLLHGRIRLTVRLEHRHDNATRTRVRADTPVIDVNVEAVQQDKKNPVATMCVSFACETLRYMVTRGGCGACAVTARDVPALLRRGAGVARTALRWGRAMHEAKLHLAYTLDCSGHLTLKVANIPLRSVWEVSMDLELVVEDARETPWPRAGNVRVTRIVSDIPISAEDVERVMAHTPKDWGHIPRTIWRIFRYLKHKTRDDDLLLGA